MGLPDQWLTKSLPAKAMFYALLISLLIALITSSLIMVSYTQRLQQERYFMQERLLRNCESGMTLLMAEPALARPRSTIDLFGNELDSVELFKEPWGFFTVAMSRAFSNSLGLPQQFQRLALLGQPLKNDSTALYLVEMNKPLSLCGKTEIRGTAYLPRAGVKRAYISGQSYIGQRLIYGEKKRSKRYLPTLDFGFLDVLYQVPSTSRSELPAQLMQSFNKEAAYFSGSSFLLEGMELKGRIVIQAADEIRVTADCVLEDVVLLARKIVIDAGFQGRLQAIATDSLLVGKGCRLDYPSVLCLWDKENTASVDLLELDDLSEVNGGILVRDDFPGKYPVKVQLEDSVAVHGVVFVDGVVELKGVVEGSVHTKSFVLKTASSIYDNHLLNATIDVTKRSPYFLGPKYLEEASWRIAVWLE